MREGESSSADGTPDRHHHPIAFRATPPAGKRTLARRAGRAFASLQYLRAQLRSGQPHSLTYNPRLDGLRGLASLDVLFYHYVVPGFGAGLYGLDIFFVLSGYLIATVIVKDVKFVRDLGNFYFNRFIRLMPGLFCVCAGVLAVCVVFSGIAPFDTIKADALSSISYSANWTRAFSLGVPAYLANCWSLGVEEQFYLLWPAICLCLIRFAPKFSLQIAVVMLMCSIAWPLWLEAHQASYDRLANGFDTRCSSLLLGCCLALARTKPYGEDVLKLLAKLWPLAIAYLVTLVVFSEDHWYVARGFAAALAAAILISAAYHAPRSAIGMLMATPPAVLAGKMSYSLYLWHYPIMLTLYLHQVPRLAMQLIGIPLSLAVGFAFYFMVERPALRLRLTPGIPRTQIGVLTFLLSLCGMIAGGYFFLHAYPIFDLSAARPLIFFGVAR